MEVVTQNAIGFVGEVKAIQQIIITEFRQVRTIDPYAANLQDVLGELVSHAQFHRVLQEFFFEHGGQIVFILQGLVFSPSSRVQLDGIPICLKGNVGLARARAEPAIIINTRCGFVVGMQSQGSAASTIVKAILHKQGQIVHDLEFVTQVTIVNVESTVFLLAMSFQPLVVSARQAPLIAFTQAKDIIAVSTIVGIFNIDVVTEIQLPEIVNSMLQVTAIQAGVLEQVRRSCTIITSTHILEVTFHKGILVGPFKGPRQSPVSVIPEFAMRRTYFRSLVISYAGFCLRKKFT